MQDQFLNIILALAEGFGLALSPCILPVLPFLLASSIGGSRIRPFLVIGSFVVSFTAFALLSRQLLVLTGVPQDILQKGAYVLLLLLGLVMVVPFLEERFARLTGGLADRAQGVGQNAQGVWGAVLTGFLIGVVWIPCAGPLLAAALVQVIQAQTGMEAVATVAAFGIGAGIPMLAIALAGQYLTRAVRFLSHHATGIRRAMGVLIVAFSLLALAGFNLGEWAVIATSRNEAKVSGSTTLEHALPQPYPAPAIGGISRWFNSPPLEMSQVKGKVVLVDFWTYSCINCIRTFPYLKDWYAKYRDQGFEIVGVHSPEFAFEAEADNVKKAIEKFGITWPVAMDNDFVTWKNFRNRYWPGHYLISRDGQVVYTHSGEGDYGITENNIRVLLGLNRATAMPAETDASSAGQTPEIYLGYRRAKNSPSPLVRDVEHPYSFPDTLPLHHWALKGSWRVEAQRIVAAEAGAALRLHFRAGKVFLVLGTRGGKPVDVRLILDGQPLKGITVDHHTLYSVVTQDQVRDGILEIIATEPGLEAYAFTFGR
ncbi:MAG: cytochrome c biogenesis protein DipZ [Pseudomonadota bacterium]|nr:cytochrome c biogenesis protein DipZ [Pseudomonadota bacterium]